MSGRMAGILVAILVGATSTPAIGQSLADVARQEAARREKIKTSGKVLTNADLPAAKVPAASPASSSPAADAAGTSGDAAPSTGEGVAGATPAAAAADKAAAKTDDAPKDDEGGWRTRAEAVNKALTEARAEVRQLRSLSDRLALEMQANDPAVVARATRERQDITAQVATAEAREAQAFAARQGLDHDARLAGVPPAWIQ